MIYCFTCKLFSSNLTNFTKGYNDWKHVYAKVSAHENNDNHRSAHTVKNNSVQNPLLYKISISKGFRFSLFTKPFTCISYITKGFVETL